MLHICDLERAISERTHVIKPGGILVIAENDMFSIESKTLHNPKRFLGKENVSVVKTSSGIEY